MGIKLTAIIPTTDDVQQVESNLRAIGATDYEVDVYDDENPPDSAHPSVLFGVGEGAGPEVTGI